MSKHCCEMMRYNVESTCEQHPNRDDCPDCLVSYSPERRAYKIIIHDGGGSGIEITYCPWCGDKLPKQKKKKR